jgi:hypothetical protein
LTGHRDSVAELSRVQIRDYCKIRADLQYRKLRSADTLGWPRASSRCRLEQQWQEPFDGRTVIVSHHAPNRNFIASDRAVDALNAVYTSDLDALVAASGAALWVHGHTHHNVNFVIGQIRVVTSPRGYVNVLSAGFDVQLLREI